jgi:PAS domain S-box-containing protein
MEVSGRAFRMLFETAEAEGIEPARIAEALPFDVAYLTNPRHRIDWGTFLAANERVAELLGRDPERLRRLGERMLRMPSFAFMQRMARLLVTPAKLFELGNRWVIPSLTPDLTPPSTTLLPDGRVEVVFELPAHHRSAEAFLHVYTGNLRATPTLLGLPAAVVDARVGPRRIDATIRLPPSHTLLERARRSLRALRRRREIYDLLDAQRREIEEAFATSMTMQRSFRDLLDNLPALVMIHREGTVLWANRAHADVLGWSQAEVVGRKVLDLVHPSAREQVARRMGTPIAAAVPPLTTILLLRRDGGAVTVDIAPPQAVDFGGPARLIVGIDASERASLQQKLITADRIASIGMLGASVAHEINNPLAYALSGVELAARQVAGLPDAPPQTVELLATALDGLHRVRAIVRDLRLLARPDDGSTQPTDVHAVLESTLALAASALSGRARVVREYGDVPPAAANAQRLGQVALNLVLNALESMSEPGELRVRTLRDDGGRVAFEVEDTGAGIPPETLARIFDPFFTTKPVGAGTGLGLAVCHQIVTGFGGEITVRSTVGRGSTFRVALPPAQPAKAAKALPAESARASSAGEGRRRVLVVDDEPQLVKAIQQMLCDHDVTTTSSAAEALERLSRGPLVELVLCDLMMAGMTGIELYEELQRVRPEVAARVTFMTGGAFTSEARDFLARVPNRCLEKPFTLEQLEAELTRAASRASSLARGPA